MKTTKHSAPGPMAGYNYEYYRALYWLAISSSSSLVGIETEDDIVIKDNNGNFIFEQDKHSLTSENYNPLSDNSYALWNSLFIWIKLIKDQKIDIEKCKFYLVTNIFIPKISIEAMKDGFLILNHHRNNDHLQKFWSILRKYEVFHKLKCLPFPT